MLRKMEIVKWTVAAMILVLSAVTTNGQGQEDITADADLEGARQVKDYYADWLSSIPGVSGVRVASSKGVPEIVVDAAQMTPQVKQIPTKLNGIPVVVQPLREDDNQSLWSEPRGARGYMPSPTPEVEVRPAPTPQGNDLWPVWPRPLGNP
jgi:hypothetical protein